MPADVESMFSVRQMPWHRSGHVLADYPGSWDEAGKLAGLTSKPSPAGSGFVRSDTGLTLWINRGSHAVIDHREMAASAPAQGRRSTGWQGRWPPATPRSPAAS